MSRLFVTLSVVLALVVGFFVGLRFAPMLSGPKADGEPVGFTIATPSPGPAQTTITRTNPGKACLGPGSCSLRIHYLRSSPAACKPGDSAADCVVPTCPPSAECITFHGAAAISSIDGNQQHVVRENVDTSGIVIMQPLWAPMHGTK